MTLASRKPPKSPENDQESENKTDDKALGNDVTTKRPWWQNLPSKKNQKNKVILEEYDKLKSSLPEWPWMAALKKDQQQNNTPPLTRKTVKDTVRVVMTSTDKPLTSTPQITQTTSSSTLMPDTTVVTASKA